MRSFAIIGAGQGGLQLGIGLLSLLKDCNVTIFTNRTATSVSQGKILSSQGMFDGALSLERNLGLNFWDNSCPSNKSVSFSLLAPHSQVKAVYWKGLTTKPFQSVDQRLKFPRFMEEFERLGGKIIIEDVGLSELVKIADSHELTIVAGGKSEISNAFPRNTLRSNFDRPQRSLSCLYVKGMTPISDNPGVRANIIPMIGEYFVMPGLTHSGHCEMMLFEGIPGSPFDCWHDIKTPAEQLEQSKILLSKFLPWEAERCQNIQLTDSNATLLGRYAPIVRHPTLKLPSGKHVLALADSFVLNDPVAGQGANNASKAAHLYLQRILTNANKPFDQSWMHETAELYWKTVGKWATRWTQTLLTPPEPQVIDLLNSASRCPLLANVLADGFDDPSTLFPWISSAEDTKRIITIFDRTAQETTSTNEDERILNMTLRP
jgi:hypothetical protein